MLAEAIVWFIATVLFLCLFAVLSRVNEGKPEFTGNHGRRAAWPHSSAR